MKKYKVFYSNESLEDLKAIYNYIALVQLEPENAKILVSSIRDRISSLDEFPLRNPGVQWQHSIVNNLRFVVVKKHIVFYFVNEEKSVVNIVRIFSSKRDISAIKKWFSEKKEK